MGSNIDADIFKILVATDNHLGYKEKDAERGNDSYNTFEEILELAVENEVDFILLGGDLFHDNNPSRNSLLKCMELIKRYSYGDKPVHFDFVSDPTENFPHLKNPVVNYKDPNLNISIPVFSIHGNHDDPSGLGQHSPLDMLSASGLVNYFGRVSDLNDIKISPLLLTKGQTKLAIFGLSAIKDERLFRLFKEGKVKMLRPKEDLDDWFNIFVLHQNRRKHSLTNYIPEQFLDNFLDLVIWGHEHECLIEPEQTDNGTFYVTQPGSSVSTSLCDGEAGQKKIGLLEVKSKKVMRILPLELKTIRPFVFDDLLLQDHDLPIPIKSLKDNPVEDFVEDYVRAMIEKSKEQLTGHPRQPKKPLIRLRVEYSHEAQMFNICRFGYKFADSVANPDEIILFKKMKKEVKKEATVGVDNEAMDSVFESEGADIKVEDLVVKYFDELEDDFHKLQLLSDKGLAFAVGQFIEKDYKDAITEMFEHQVTKTKNQIMTVENVDENNIDEHIENFRLHRLTNKGKQDEQDEIAAFQNPSRKRKSPTVNNNSDLSDDSMDEQSVTTATASTTRGGRGSRSLARGGRGRARGRKAQLNVTGDDDDNCVVTTRGRGRGRRARGTASGNSAANNQTSMNSFLGTNRSSRTISQRKGISFDSDSD